MSQNTNNWTQIKIMTTNVMADTVAEIMESLGALAVSYTDAKDSPILEPRPGERKLWPNTEVTALWDKGTDAKPLLEKLKLLLGDHFPMMAVSLEDKNWIRAWMDQFKPLKFGSRLWICPSWMKVDVKGATVVTLDPGLAFGTGTHPTTALCLEFLDSLDLSGKTVLDYGCGSGILAIASLRLGAKEAFGVDIDDQALEASLANAAENAVADKLKLFAGGHTQGIAQCDVTLSNILAGPLSELEPILARHTKSKGRIALSGILEEQSSGVLETYAKDFIMDKVKLKDGWALLSGVRK